MEAFESFVALTMEADTEDGRLVVSEAIKFPVIRQTAKTSRVEVQTHGFEVDLVGARRDRLVLATVKSFFGSRGVVAEHVIGSSQTKRFNSLYALINDPVVRDAVIDGASRRYGVPDRPDRTPALCRQVRRQQDGRARTPHPRMGRNADRRCRSDPGLRPAGHHRHRASGRLEQDLSRQPGVGGHEGDGRGRDADSERVRASVT